MRQLQVFTFTKKIKEPRITFKILNDLRDIRKLEEIVRKLEGLPRVATTSLEGLGLRTNPRKWIVSLLNDYPAIVKSDMENLLFDFTDMMKTRMREETKYVLGVLYEKKLLLCHSVYGEETITPEWKIIPRMLDVDNVLRFVSFGIESDSYKVRYWERDATSSFMEWLGVPKKQAFLFGGRYRMLSEIEGVVVEFQLAEDDIDAWLKEHPELEDGYVNLKSPLHKLSIREVRVAGRRYDSVADFIQDFEAEKQGLPQYQAKYREIKEKNLPLLMQFYDERKRVVRLEGDEEFTEIYKTTPGFDIIFADEMIKLRASYLKDIAKRCINGEPIKIVHVGGKFKTPPLVVGKTEIYNELVVPDGFLFLNQYYNQSEVVDKKLNVLLKYLLFKVLVQANLQSPLAIVLNSIAIELGKEVSLDGRIVQTENSIIEYKARDYFLGRDKEIIERFAADIGNKIESSNCKIYLVGIEDNGQVAPIGASRLKSDRIESIRQGIEKRLPHVHLQVFPIVADGEGLLLMIAERRVMG